MQHRWLLALLCGAALATSSLGCDELGGDCADNKTCETASGGQGGTGAAGPGGGGSTTTQGGGGAGAGMPSCTDDPAICTDQGLVCHEGACVQCVPGDDANCTGETPWCNPTTLACQACSYHEHCPTSACNVFTGACLDAEPKTVGPEPGDDFPSLTLALASVVGDDEEAVFLVSPTAGDYNETVTPTIAGTRAIALLGSNGRPVIRATSGGPTFDVYNGATLLLEGIDLKSNGNAVAISAAGRVALDRVEIAQNSGGGIGTSGTSAELLIRNSIIAGNGNSDVHAISLGQGKLELLFSSVGGGTISPSAAISCAGGHDLTVRNSVLFNRHAGGPLESCGNATISHTAADENLSGTGNTLFTVEASLFANLNNGNLRLTANGLSAFDAVALWQPGDPLTDIDGQPRPTTEGPDVAGAHRGP